VALKLLLFLCALSLSACNPYTLKTVAKSDIDLVVDAHWQNMNLRLQAFMIKLYQLNPTAQPLDHTVQDRLQQIFQHPGAVRFKELQQANAETALTLAFSPDFNGDRIFALTAGLTDMIHQAYGYRHEFFVLDRLNQQSLYNSARNLEFIASRLKQQPYLVTQANQIEQLERLFGQMIATQDMLARITADATHRSINTVIHGIASATLLPVGL